MTVCSEFSQNPGNPVNKITWPGLFRTAVQNSITVQNIVSGFSSCGIIPFNPLRIPSVAFAPSAAYEANIPIANEHPLQWTVPEILKGKQSVSVVTQTAETVVTVQGDVDTGTKDSVAAVNDSDVPNNAGDADTHLTPIPQQVILESPSSPENPLFTNDLSAELLLPFVDDETRQAVEGLISLEAGSEEIVYEVSLNTSGIENTCIDLPIDISQNVGKNGQTESLSSVDWNTSVSQIFFSRSITSEKGQVGKAHWTSFAD